MVFLHQEHVNESRLLVPVVHAFAGRHKDVKLMQIRADACIEAYPDRNVPTLLLYHEGALQGQVVGLGELGGLKVTIDGKCSPLSHTHTRHVGSPSPAALPSPLCRAHTATRPAAPTKLILALQYWSGFFRDVVCARQSSWMTPESGSDGVEQAWEAVVAACSRAGGGQLLSAMMRTKGGRACYPSGHAQHSIVCVAAGYRPYVRSTYLGVPGL